MNLTYRSVEMNLTYRSVEMNLTYRSVEMNLSCFYLIVSKVQSCSIKDIFYKIQIWLRFRWNCNNDYLENAYELWWLITNTN